jgi:surface antigen
MNKLFLAVAATLAAVASPALADTVIETGSAGSSSRELPPYLQCVPYARQVSGINIFGDAHTWWNQAAGRYERGHTPKVGAVMAFRPQGNMRLGHVAAVSKIIDKRTVLLRHANWSPIGGRRGQIENDVRAIDVSPDNDWSEVRVWYAPIQDLGGTAWPVEGFIYNDRPGQVGQIAAETPRRTPTTVAAKRRADVVGDIIARSS